MNRTHEDGSWVMRSARAVGDLGNPFYAEERQRDVWNEASAVGLQLAIWLMLLAATVMVWVGGRDAVPYALAVFVLAGAVSWTTVLYALALGVDASSPQHVLRARLLPYLALLVLLVVGTVRALGHVSPSVAAGAAVGAGIAVAGLTLARRRRSAAPARADD
ncbi:MAG: DUF2029 domain-containing protein [Actinomycetota bacterium]